MTRTIRSMQLAAQRPDTSADVAWRKRHNAACEQARRERERRFPVLTDANADAALEFQASRINELMNRTCERCGSPKPIGESCGCFDNGGQ